MNKPLQPLLKEDPEWDDLAAKLETLDPPPELRNLSDEEMDAQADADVAAGRLISHERVKAWLEALKSDANAPPPEPDVCGL